MLSQTPAELGSYPLDGNNGRANLAYAGPVADELARLEKRIEELEAKLSQGVDDNFSFHRFSASDLAVILRAAIHGT